MPTPLLQPAFRTAVFKVGDGSRAEFMISDFGLADPFSSFLPGIAGPGGVPLWCFYVNRGQAVAAFGVENKDGAILEFESANKAYRNTALTGFRTFLRFTRDGLFYEPFQETQANAGHQRRTSMVISPHDLRIEDENLTLGLRVKVRYFGLANRPIAALCREVVVEDLRGESRELEILDGLPQAAPFGLGDLQRKTMGRTMEAWSYCEGLDENLPYLRQRCSSEDAVEVRAIKEGHFFGGILADGTRGRAVVDPTRVFATGSSLDYPAPFADGQMSLAGQRVENRTPSAMLHYRGFLAPGRALSLYSVHGRAGTPGEARHCVRELGRPGAFEAWSRDNERTVLGVAGPGWVGSGLPALDGYALQNFLDNVMRGGLPVTLADGKRRRVLHLYSRKHGDLERDYNAFSLTPSPFSQGNGAFRDICQNRRNDGWVNPDLVDGSIRYFAGLWQLDGNNPLLVQGLEYFWEGGEKGQTRLESLLGPAQAKRLLAGLGGAFTPRQVHAFFRDQEPDRPELLASVMAAVLTRSRAVEKAEPGEGYWTDHGFYVVDMLERFETLYPERLASLLNDPDLTFYDNPLVVVPRSKKLRQGPQGWRQYGSVVLDPEKSAAIAQRTREGRRVRTLHGKGEILRTSLWAKLLCFAANKLASLDAAGAGLEMDAEKPGWNDSLNGLPGLFASSVNDAMALKRLILDLLRWMEEKPSPVSVPEELAAFLEGLTQADTEAFGYWQAAGRLKEAYREATRLGVAGPQVRLEAAEIARMLKKGLDRLEAGLATAKRPDGLLHSYFMHVPEVDNGGPEPRITGFARKDLPLFLEGQVHALRLLGADQAGALARAVERSPLYDARLGMFKVNAPLDGVSPEIGRIKAFTPGWLENESIFLHMEYKYLLELLRLGLHRDFYRHLFAACPAFLDGRRYGRSVFENSSFIASTANPDPATHGRGYVARLSGTTGEFHEMVLTMGLGPRPFRMLQGRLVFEPKPALHGSFFRTEPGEVEVPMAGGPRRLGLEKGAFAFRCFGDTVVVVHARPGAGADEVQGPAVERISLGTGSDALRRGPILEASDAFGLRAGGFDRVDLWLA